MLLDLVRFYTEDGAKPLPYDPWATHAIPAGDLAACAEKQEGEGLSRDASDVSGFTGCGACCFGELY